MARYRKCLPSGKKAGQRCDVCCAGSSLVRGSTVWLPGPIFINGAFGPGEKMIVPSGPHAPPRPGGESSAKSTAVPALISTFFSPPREKNPSQRLSGDQNRKYG